MASELITQATTDEARVLGWRLEELERAGYDRAAAWDVAERTEIDLHLAVGIRRAGCPPDTALRILL
jgi:hypothetical protein